MIPINASGGTVPLFSGPSNPYGHPMPPWGGGAPGGSPWWAGTSTYGRLGLHAPNSQQAAMEGQLPSMDGAYGGMGYPGMMPSPARSRMLAAGGGGMGASYPGMPPDRFAGVYGPGARSAILDQDAMNTANANAAGIEDRINSGQITNPGNIAYAQRQARLQAGQAGNISGRLWGPLLPQQQSVMTSQANVFNSQANVGNAQADAIPKMLPFQQNYLQSLAGGNDARTAEQYERTREMAGWYPGMLTAQKDQNTNFENMMPFAPLAAQSNLDAQRTNTAAQTERTREMAGWYPGMLTAQKDQNTNFENMMPFAPLAAQSNLDAQRTNTAAQTERTREMAGWYPGMLTAQKDQNTNFENMMPFAPLAAQSNLDFQNERNKAYLDDPTLFRPPTNHTTLPSLPAEFKGTGATMNADGTYATPNGKTYSYTPGATSGKRVQEIENYKPSTSSNPVPTPNGGNSPVSLKPVRRAVAQAFLQRAKGDRQAAIQALRERGYDPSQYAD